MLDLDSAISQAYSNIKLFEHVSKLDKKQIPDNLQNRTVDVWVWSKKIHSEKIKRIELYIRFLDDFPLSFPKMYLTDQSIKKVGCILFYPQL
jgi:hypothetical protein